MNDCEAKLIICSDGSYRENKAIDLKGIIDKAVEKCPSVERVLVVKRTGGEVNMKEGRDFWLDDYYPKASSDFVTKNYDAKTRCLSFIHRVLQKPKGMLHTCAGYMVYTAYTFKNVFNYRENDIYWCTADIG